MSESNPKNKSEFVSINERERRESAKSLIERWHEDEDPFGLADESPFPDDEDSEE